MIARVSEDGVKEDNSPKGDGNKMYTLYHLHMFTVKEDNSPKGDGNFFVRQVFALDFLVKEDNSPKGDGNKSQ